MRAVVCSDFSRPLAVQDVSQPAMGDDDVLIAVAASGVNFVDGLIVSGRYQLKPKLPYVPGFEIAGHVVDHGANVTHVTLGQTVFATCGLDGGGYAAFASVPESAVFPLPNGMSPGQGATFVQSYCTALFALTTRIQLTAGATLLVLGASGGVGRAAVDVGKALGARVIAAASSQERLDACAPLAPDATINYGEEDLKTRARELSGGGVDVVYDPLGGDYADAGLRALGDDGVLLIVGFAAGQIPQLPANQILLRNRRVVGVDWGGWRSQHRSLQADLMATLSTLYDDGALHPCEPASYPLDQATQVLADVNQRRVVGKVVLIPCSDSHGQVAAT